MSMNTAGLLSAILDYHQTLGLFEVVNLNEPVNAPGGTGLFGAVWLDDGKPVADLSGLAATSWRIQMGTRVYLDMLHEPRGSVDTVIAGALDALVAAYSDGFTLGGLVESVDLLGAYGESLSWKFQYATHNQRLYRIATVITPLIVSDVYVQGA